MANLKRNKGQGWQFAQVPIYLIIGQRINGSAKDLWIYLSWRQGHDDHCWVSQRRIALDLGMSLRTVRRATRELQDAGFLEVEEHPGAVNYYNVIADNQQAREEADEIIASNSLVVEQTQGTPVTDDSIPRSSVSDIPVTDDRIPRSRMTDVTIEQNDKSEREGEKEGGTDVVVSSLAFGSYPALAEYIRITGAGLKVVQAQAILDAVGSGEVEVSRWAEIVTDWTLAGHNVYNVAGMIDAYRKGGIRSKRQETTVEDDVVFCPYVD